MVSLLFAYTPFNSLTLCSFIESGEQFVEARFESDLQPVRLINTHDKRKIGSLIQGRIIVQPRQFPILFKIQSPPQSKPLCGEFKNLIGCSPGWFRKHYSRALQRCNPSRHNDNLSHRALIPDLPENYAVLHFDLQETINQTILTLTIRNLLTFEIFKHMEFYWKTALHLLKEVAERP